MGLALAVHAQSGVCIVACIPPGLFSVTGGVRLVMFRRHLTRYRVITIPGHNNCPPSHRLLRCEVGELHLTYVVLIFKLQCRLKVCTVDLLRGTCVHASLWGVVRYDLG